MRVAVCDDNKIDRSLVCALVRRFFDEESVRLDLTEYDNGKNLIADVEEERPYDIVFLDIIMDEIIGINVARRLREVGYSGEIVFITSSPEYAVDGYDVRALNYIIKPVSYEKLKGVLTPKIGTADKAVYQIKSRSLVVRVPYDEIVFIEYEDSNSVLHQKGSKTYRIYKKIGDIFTELNDKRFLRCHRGYIVNMDYVSKISQHFELITGDVVLITQRDLKSVRLIYMSYIDGKNN